MTRDEILELYKVVNGKIVSPGKYEGEPAYVPYYWGLVLENMQDEIVDEEIGLYAFDLDSVDHAMWPELAGFTHLEIAEGSDGFVTAACA